jgi:NlpC/P60 family
MVYRMALWVVFTTTAIAGYGSDAEHVKDSPYPIEYVDSNQGYLGASSGLRTTLKIHGMTWSQAKLVGANTYRYLDGKWNEPPRASSGTSVFSKIPPSGVHHSALRLELPSDPEDLKALAKEYALFRSPEKIYQDFLKARADGKDSIELEQILNSSIYSKYLGKFIFFPEEANCFGTALAFHRCLPRPTHIQSRYVMPLIKQNFVSLVAGDQLSPGDLVVLRKGGDGRPLHGAIYLGGNFFFHKSSGADEEPMTVQGWDDVVGSYRDLSLTFEFYRSKKVSLTKSDTLPPGPFGTGHVIE